MATCSTSPVATPAPPPTRRSPPRGHGVRYGADGQILGVTVINARWLLDRDGHFTITLPREVRVDAHDLAGR